MESVMKGTVLEWRRKSARVAFVVFSGVALSLMPLRALCELRLANAAQTMGEHRTEHAAGHGEGKSGLCCASIDSALVNSAVPDLSGGPSAAHFVVPLFAALTLSGSVVLRMPLAGPPPPSLSYYARSSRILR